MARLIIRNRCSICGKEVELVPDNVLKVRHDEYDTEYVVTHSGYKQYIHSSCWAKKIKKQHQGVL